MNYTQFAVSFLYACGRIAVGLLLHPYQTMQSLVQERVFLWLVLLPTTIFILAKFVWLLIIVPLVQFVFSCSSSGFFACDLIPFFANWLVLFCVYWQVLLLYLAVRFAITFRD